jgi:hypothetical protein
MCSQAVPVLRITDERIRDVQEATFKLLTAADSASGEADAKGSLSSIEASLDSIRVSGTNFDTVFSTIDSALRKLEPSRGWGSRLVVDKALLHIAALVGSKFVNQECPGLTSTDALVYFWMFCRMMECVLSCSCFDRKLYHPVRVLVCAVSYPP